MVPNKVLFTSSLLILLFATTPLLGQATKVTECDWQSVRAAENKFVNMRNRIAEDPASVSIDEFALLAQSSDFLLECPWRVFCMFLLLSSTLVMIGINLSTSLPPSEKVIRISSDASGVLLTP